MTMLSADKCTANLCLISSQQGGAIQYNLNTCLEMGLQCSTFCIPSTVVGCLLNGQIYSNMNFQNE
jgi:hypothetical protein